MNGEEKDGVDELDDVVGCVPHGGLHDRAHCLQGRAVCDGHWRQLPDALAALTYAQVAVQQDVEGQRHAKILNSGQTNVSRTYKVTTSATTKTTTATIIMGA